nr:MAG TPA: hypothetical protein [Caudoviricetes sp.]
MSRNAQMKHCDIQKKQSQDAIGRAWLSRLLYWTTKNVLQTIVMNFPVQSKILNLTTGIDGGAT